MAKKKKQEVTCGMLPFSYLLPGVIDKLKWDAVGGLHCVILSCMHIRDDLYDFIINMSHACEPCVCVCV